ncbi:hypothetical protein D9619_000281 [Psilocybe cf. subviscida]|uniref:RNA polymerase II assembly factor Rtp1 C-terminal domain-containing protein n=1 Tax=Psilocybe cf. subviscida TaxID=2480587 RepID=A0A8H5BDZ8_9AGAR|nr:hypothetical protein D9619_000281 [Psilocybe cf. subviscida]
MSTKELAAALGDGAVLLGTGTPSNPASNLESALRNRLSVYYERIGEEEPSLATQDDVQLVTAKEAIRVVQRVHRIIDLPAEEDPVSGEGPAIGTRDLGQLRTLMSITLKWAMSPLFQRVSREWPSNQSKIIDLTLEVDDYRLLCDLTLAFLALIFPDGPQGRISQTLITTSILSLHVGDLLLPALSLGWLPELQATSVMQPLHSVRPLVTRLIKLLTPAQAISSLTGVLALGPPIHARKACTYFLARQVTRPHGVKGLYEAAFQADESGADEAKFEQLSRTLLSVPAGMKPEDYYKDVFGQICKILVSEAQVAYRRAAAFAVYRAVVPQNDKAGPHQAIARAIVLSMLQQPFLDPSESSLSATDALWLLTILISNTEPSPTFISLVLSPLISALYGVSYDLDQRRTSAPQVKESIIGLLKAWGKIIDDGEGTDVLWHIIEGGKEWEWSVDLEGNLIRGKSGKKSAPELMMPDFDKKNAQASNKKQNGKQSLLLDDEDEDGGDEDAQADEDLNIFDLFPDPVHFVQFLKQLDRPDIGSALFIRLLEAYRASSKTRSDEESMRTLHKLQIIMQMQKRLAEGTSANILRKPDQLLSFVFHVLEAASMTLVQQSGGAAASTSATAPSSAPVAASRPRAPRIEVIDEEADDDEFDQEMDSDDEDPQDTDADIIGPDDELIETAITLLLSILEADETLTARTHPIFNDIFAKLEPLSLRGSSVLRPLAREARLVITARLAQPSAGSTSNRRKRSGEEDSTQETYQKALKLLQDPILPVRGHGLLLLRELVQNSASATTEGGNGRQLNRALVPSILSIFLQAVQDEDSYMFLNAVQGLAALADVLGREIIQALVNDYSRGLSGLGAGNLTQHDMDVRTRIGEALAAVIKKCGTTLGMYVDLLVPPLFSMVRQRNVPTALRTSALSLLATCVDIYALAMLPYVVDLLRAMVDLLRTEGVTAQPEDVRRQMAANASANTGPSDESKDKDPDAGTNMDSEGEDKPQAPPSLDIDPTSKNAKFPPLRRAALHFLSMLVRSATALVYDGTTRLSGDMFPRDLVRSISVTLGYIAATDEDSVVQVMARETKKNMEELQQAVFGL